MLKITSLARIWRNCEHHTLLVEVEYGAATVVNSLAVFQKDKHRINVCMCAFCSVVSNSLQPHGL